MDTQTSITIIAAMNMRRYIGKGNELLWKIPSDMKRFKELTTGGTVIMGRKTYESIGTPLPGRENIVISRNVDLSIPGCMVRDSIASALVAAHTFTGKPIFIIGGGEIYRQALEHATDVHLTVVFDREIVGDTLFPPLPKDQWSRETHEVGVQTERDEYPFEFLTYKRITDQPT